MARTIAGPPVTGCCRNIDRIERATRIRPGPGTVVGRAALEGRTVQIADAWTDPLYEAKDEARAGNVRSMLGVPLMRENTVIGVIGLARGTLEPFHEREIQLVTTFADQAVIAIENARLFGELRQRTDDLAQSVEELKALGEVSQAVNSTLDLQTVLTTIVPTAVEISATDAGAIYVFDDRDSGLPAARHHRHERGHDRARSSGQRIDAGIAAVGDAAARRAPVQVADLRDEPPIPSPTSSCAPGSARSWSCRCCAPTISSARWWCAAARRARSRPRPSTCWRPSRRSR